MISLCCFAANGRQKLLTHAARAARLFVPFKPITFWLGAVVVAIGVVLAEAPCQVDSKTATVKGTKQSKNIIASLGEKRKDCTCSKLFSYVFSVLRKGLAKLENVVE